MKTVKNYLLMLLASITLFAFTSCQSEEEMENRILEGYCWEGTLPIDNGNDCYSRFYFEADGSGVEEVYVNGRYNGEYEFTWGWKNGDYALLLLTYRSGRYTSGSCISVSYVSKSRLEGYYYEKYSDYSYDMTNYGSPDESYRVTLKTQSGVHRHNQ